MKIEPKINPSSLYKKTCQQVCAQEKSQALSGLRFQQTKVLTSLFRKSQS
jgi:hypothetical protein